MNTSDILKDENTSIDCGVYENQAKVPRIDNSLLTKSTLSTKSDLKNIELALKKDLLMLENRITIKFGSMLIVAGTIMITILKWHS